MNISANEKKKKLKRVFEDLIFEYNAAKRKPKPVPPKPRNIPRFKI